LNPLSLPRCFYASEDESVIVLENVAAAGSFEVTEKKPEPLTAEAVQLILRELAALHASGLHFIQGPML
jgi:hypothetical protein